MDDLLATCSTLGLQTYVTLSQTPNWLGLNRGDLPPVYDWQRFCTAFAQHYAGRMTFVGCWNEFQGSPQDYVNRLLRPMATAFRDVDAQYQICGPEMATVGAWDVWLKTCLTLGADCLDALTIHSYDDDGAAVWKKLTQPRKRWEFWKKKSIKQIVEESGAGSKLCWLTETGWKSDEVGEDRQARYVDQILERVLGSDWPAGVVIYQLLDEPNVSFGVFKENGGPKEAARVIQKYTQGVV